MRIRLKITRVDMNGYWGRERHPAKTDEGLTVTAVAMSAWHNADDGEVIELAPDGSEDCERPELAHDGERAELVWKAVTDDGRTLDLIDHEVEVIVEQ